MRIPRAAAPKHTSFGHFASLIHFTMVLVTLFMVFNETKAEGSKDFINYPGYRMFLDTRDTQQLKVFVNKDDHLNIGSSHLGIQGGFIRIYRPDGTLFTTLTGNNGTEGIIYNKSQEVSGPTGGGTSGGTGYKPWSYKVPAGQEGVWTVYFGYPTYVTTDFPNILNSFDWNRAQHQPNTPRVVLAWDITVTQLAAGNNGGLPVTGRVFTNEYITVVNQNGFKTSPKFFVLTKDGFVFKVEFMDADPFRFPISSNNIGFSKYNIEPLYKSQPRNMVTRSLDPNSWVPNMYYLYEPQAQDYSGGLIVNNKIFFNQPDKNLPTKAWTSDVFRQVHHETWMLNVPQSFSVSITNFRLVANDSNDDPCDPGTMQTGGTGAFAFNSNVSGTATLSLDMTGDGDFNDARDRTIYSNVNIGDNLVAWDGRDGLGNHLPAGQDIQMAYLIKVRGGETHILLTDVENNEGGVIFTMANNTQPGVPTDLFYYDHSAIGGGVSGNGTPGNALPTNQPYTYNSNFGNNNILDYWAFFDYAGQGSGTLVFDITDDCNPDPDPGPDKDQDGIPDMVDIDDDNDGVPDKKEFCNPGGGFACLPGGFDPSGDNDNDGVPNYRDHNDPSFVNPCLDADSDGICDRIAAVYDTDGDGIADHLDLDSDNDGISDLVEAGHNQPDANRNGVIDGPPAIFGLNGLYNPIASHPDNVNATETYTRWDWDTDGVPDHDDLDADNDGINDVAEAGFAASDTNNDGRIDNGAGLPPTVGLDGLAPVIDPAVTGAGIPLPRDKDADNIPDWHDLDSDNDLIHDVEEGGNPDPDNNGVIGSGLPAVNPNGQATASGLAPTSRPIDTDKDLVPDYHDLDSDNDGINDVREADGTDPDNDGLPGTGPVSVNTKGVPASVNGNPLASSSKPADTDGDLIRDYRDLDSDNDNINDVAETNKPDTDNDGRVGAGIPPVNVHGQATSILPTSAPTDTDNDGTPDFRELDSDSDGIDDVLEANQPDQNFDGMIGPSVPTVDVDGRSNVYLSTSKPTDSDGDGRPDFQQLDSDSDGILDVEECPDPTPCRDWDGDVTPDFQDPDRDDDGIFDGYECETGFPCPDTDNDGIPDVDDLDTDGDMLSDTNECPLGDPCPDANNNGIPEWREYFCNPNIITPIVENVSSTGTVFCEGSSVLFNAANSVDVIGDSVTYQWVGPNGFNFTATTTEFGPFPVSISNMTAQNAGNYTLYLFTEEGCVGTPGNVALTVTDMPQTPSLNIEEDILCVGEMLELNSTIAQGNGIQYEWWFDSGTGPVSLGTTQVPTFFINNVTTANIGNYYVSVLSGGCTSQLSNAQNVAIDNVIAGLTPYLNVEEDVLCEGQTIELNSTPYAGQNVSYHWWFNDGSGPVSIGITDAPTFFLPNATAANSGIYSVMIFSGNCASQSSNLQDVDVNNDLSSIVPALQAGANVLCDGQMIELNSTAFGGQNIQYLWWFDNGTGNNLLAITDVPTYFIPDATSDNSGVYSVSVTMGLCQTGLSNLQNIEVSNIFTGQTPALSVLEDNPCFGTSIELNSTIMSGSNVTYNWYFDNGNGRQLIASTDVPTYFIDNVTAANTGIYLVTVSFGNCETPFSNAQDVAVTTDLINQVPQISVNNNVICDGEMLELNSTPALGANVTYEWWFDSGNGPVSLGTTTVPTFFVGNVTDANAGIYSVTFSVGDCASQMSNLQQVAITTDLNDQTPGLSINDDSLCDGDMLVLNSSMLNGGLVTYNWFYDDGNGPISIGTTDVPTFFIQNVTTANTGTYTVQASIGNCVSQPSNAIFAAVTNLLDTAPALSANDGVLCEGQTLELNSSIVQGNNVIYHWYYDNGNGPVEIAATDVPTYFIGNVEVANAGIYLVGVQVGGCVSQLSNAQQVAVQQAPNLVPTNTTDALNVACPGDLIELNIPMVLGATYQWAGPQGFAATTSNPVIENASVKNAGDYQVVVTTEGCVFTSAITTVFVYDQVNADDDSFQITETDSLTVADFMSNDVLGNVENWTIQIVNAPINGILTGQGKQLVYFPRKEFSGNDVFTYEICNTDCPDQCELAVVSVRTFSNKEEEACFVPNIITPNDDGANDFFTVPCLETEYRDNNLKIFNRWGDQVHEAQPYKNDWAGTYRNVPLPPGTYFYVLLLDRSTDHCQQGYFTITR